MPYKIPKIVISSRNNLCLRKNADSLPAAPQGNLLIKAAVKGAVVGVVLFCGSVLAQAILSAVIVNS